MPLLACFAELRPRETWAYRRRLAAGALLVLAGAAGTAAVAIAELSALERVTAPIRDGS